MFAKSTITLFVLAVGLSSLLSGNSIGSASAYPRPDETSMNINADNPNDVKLFEDLNHMREGNNFGALTVLRNNVIQGSNTRGENHLGTETDQKHIMVGGKLPGGGHTYGGATYGSGNAIQESDSSSKNFLGSRLSQRDIVYKVKGVPEDETNSNEE
ncbi:GSCOCT00014247001.2-RA-CDS [Cotesia congregata]|uniref:Uncharacterized protein n=1 Tax=Cotesia congregata TaxID=51543 RepID=S6D9J5_COTCN|nr:GSCOCT00014228001.2-RA-CDS [Cotesia congregata]CAD6243477.1 GSCOCT00014247001.2-RA-CDS [Cotesia congregata]CCQ71142.1 hypothetical protein BV7-1 [Cotesia congregata]CCQ71160.1 hypothetical protein BV7-6 [Cotesia congregata]